MFIASKTDSPPLTLHFNVFFPALPLSLHDINTRQRDKTPNPDLVPAATLPCSPPPLFHLSLTTQVVTKTSCFVCLECQPFQRQRGERTISLFGFKSTGNKRRGINLTPLTSFYILIDSHQQVTSQFISNQKGFFPVVTCLESDRIACVRVLIFLVTLGNRLFSL